MLQTSIRGCAQEEKPESQRVTLPSPIPFRLIAPCVRRSPGEYRIVHDEPKDIDESGVPTRRSL